MVEPKKGMMFNAGLPEVLTGSVVHHVETQHSISRVILYAKKAMVKK